MYLYYTFIFLLYMNKCIHSYTYNAAYATVFATHNADATVFADIPQLPCTCQ